MPRRDKSAGRAPSEQWLREDALQRQQGPLDLQAAAEAAYAAVALHDAVARDDDRERIGTHGCADRARRARLAEPVGQVLVADDGAVADAGGEFALDAPVEAGGQRPVQVERESP